jgi:hypothetical protein
VRPGDRQRHLDEWVREWPRPETWDERRAQREHAEYRTHMPAFRDAVVGSSNGHVWLEPYELWNETDRVFIGYHRYGRAVARLHIPHEDRILDIDAHRALLLSVDEDGSEQVRVVELR